MARLTKSDKEAFKTLTKAGYIQEANERSPVFVVPTAETNEDFCRWLSSVTKWMTIDKPARFSGDHWKL